MWTWLKPFFILPKLCVYCDTSGYLHSVVVLKQWVYSMPDIVFRAFLPTFIQKKVKNSNRYVFPRRGFSPSLQKHNIQLPDSLVALLLQVPFSGSLLKVSAFVVLLTMKHVPVFMHRHSTPVLRLPCCSCPSWTLSKAWAFLCPDLDTMVHNGTSHGFLHTLTSSGG